MTSLRRSLALSFAEKYSTLLVHLASSLAIARLLTPSEIGIFSVGASLVAIAHTLRDVGVTAYLIQTPDPSRQHIRAALGVTLAVAWSISGILAIVAFPAAAFYGEPGVAEVLRVLAVNFLLIPFGSITLALMRRELDFGAIYRINLSSASVQAASSIVLALGGFGFMSLAWASLAGTATTVAMALLLRRRATIFLPSLHGAREVVSFGARSSIASIASEAGSSAPDLVIAKVMGFDAVGMFSRAMGFVLLFERAVTDGVRGVALPHLASQRRAGVPLAQPYALGVSHMTVVAWPILGLLALNAAPLIHLLYGDQWLAAAPLAKVIALAVAIRCMNPIAAALLLAHGDAQSVMNAQLMYQGLKVVLILLASLFGLAGVAWSLVGAEALGTALFGRAVARHIDFPLMTYATASARSALVTVFVLASAWGFNAFLAIDQYSELVRVPAVFFLSIAVWLLGVFLFGHPIARELRRLRSKHGLSDDN